MTPMTLRARARSIFVVYVYVDTDVHAYVVIDARVQAIMQSASATAPWGVITKEESLLRGLR